MYLPVRRSSFTTETEASISERERRKLWTEGNGRNSREGRTKRQIKTKHKIEKNHLVAWL